jgi:RNA-directed DNA polymerase
VVIQPKQGIEAEEKKAAEEIVSNRRQRWAFAETSIWSDNMLMALENGVKGDKWFSLIDKVYKRANLESAWKRVLKNKGAAGVDNITVTKFNKSAQKYILEIQEELKTGTYKPHAVKRVYIPKGGDKKKKRPLGIPVARDRLVQAAIKQAIEPIFEKEFLDMSYGFRPGKGAKDALREVDKAIKEGYIWVVDADIQGYFDAIPHDNLMRKVEEKISDGKLLSIIKSFLVAKIMEEMKGWIPDKGTPQGGVLSPLLANIYLHDLDVLITKAGIKMFRYADDYVALTKDENTARRALEMIRVWTLANGLTLHPEKTHVGNCTRKGEGFEFLGYRFECGTKQVRKKSLDKMKDKVREYTKRTCGVSMEMVATRLNPVLKGWFGYFKHAHKWTFTRLDGWIRRRLRAILRRQEKRPGRGKTYDDHKRWPNEYFRKLGIFSLEKAYVIAKANQSR